MQSPWLNVQSCILVWSSRPPAARLRAMVKRKRLDISDETLQQLLHTGRISNQGLSRLLKKLSGKDNDPAENTIVRHRAEVNSAAFKTLGWEVPVLLTDGRQWIWKLLDPCKTLAAIVEKSPGMQALYAQAWRRTPPTPATPWRVVLGFDEFTPGNKQSLDQTRKTMVVSYSFLELGQAALSRGRVWVTFACIRSVMIKEASRSPRCLDFSVTC